jgi:hypothetical protein
MEDARAAKEDKQIERGFRVRFRSGSKDRDGMRVLHGSYPDEAE